MAHLARRIAWCLPIAATTACSDVEPPATESFYDRKIGPILIESCSKGPTESGCHTAADNRGNAFGNLNVESYETLTLRRDLLLSYGPYRMPALLAKTVPDFQLAITLWNSEQATVITTAIPHAGGPRIDVASASFSQLERWIERGATESNELRLIVDARRTGCRDEVGDDPAFDPTTDPPQADFETFRTRVNPVITERCAAGNCHGAPANSMYLTCGNTPEQVRWNYFAAGDYLSTKPDSSELLRRSLSPTAGGTYHEGGEIFSSPDASGYRAILAWAEEKGGPSNVPTDPGFLFFAERVQPMLVKKGCMLIGCHSPAMGHDYRLRGGSGGHFGLGATRRNYDLSLGQIALASPDPNASRILRKNLAPLVEAIGPQVQNPLGILHRGGAIFGHGNDMCDSVAAASGPLDEQDPYCVIVSWIELERESRMATAQPLSAIVYVRRPGAPGRDGPQDFETFAGGADLIRAPAAFDANGNLTVQTGTSLLSQCGLAAGIDVRRPAVSWDGARIAFSARASADTPYQVYVIDGAQCSPDATINAPPVDDAGGAVPDNGELVHNFDPAFAPDGSIVFASTRGNIINASSYGYEGPQRTPADPSKLNANLYVAEPGGTVRQLTFLLNQELLPSFMADGRLVFVTEKRAPGFYQLAGRRQNLDGGDYHPLFAQRSTLGYEELAGVVELADKNLAGIVSDRGAVHGAGALAIVNRSLGIDQQSADPDDYVHDPGAMDWQNPDFFQHSLRVLDGVGRPGEGGRVYRDPSALPNGHVLVSMAADVADVGAFAGGFDLVVVNPITTEVSAPLIDEADDDVLWPVAVYARPNHGIFRSRLDEPNGASRIATEPDRAEVLYLDVPLLASLLFQNTRSRRLISEATSALEVWESLPPEAGVTSFAAGGSFVTNDQYGDLYVRRRRLGALSLAADGSAHAALPGGTPIVLATSVRLEGDRGATLHHQREEMQFYPGEVARQGFRRELFDGLCGSCHGSVTGFESHVALNPDILTQASSVAAATTSPDSLLGRSGPIEGPPVP